MKTTKTPSTYNNDDMMNGLLSDVEFTYRGAITFANIDGTKLGQFAKWRKGYLGFAAWDGKEFTAKTQDGILRKLIQHELKNPTL